MVYYLWDKDKNKLLKETRGVSFEQAVMHIQNGDVLDIIEHPNQDKYTNQYVIILNINNYAYAVPFVQQKTERFLKTIIPSRRLTKKYLR